MCFSPVLGVTCALSCVIPPTDAVVLPSNVTADNMEHWMEATKVQNIVCTGILRWYPDPHLIHCIQSCEVSKYFILQLHCQL
uniref:Secreted protein n=1 Tax=Callorhinchus milii TaxID=7868 RepID=A0A4W3GA62_CALMI